MARTSVANSVERIRRRLASGQRDEVNLLAEPLDDSQSKLTFMYDLPAGLKPGAIICIGLETMRVMAVDLAIREATVIRGWQDSEPQAHEPGSEVWVNPRFQPVDIFEAMRDELASWGPELYKVDGVEIAIADGTDTYELSSALAECYHVIAVYRRWNDLGQYLEPSTAWPRMPFRVQRGAGATWATGPSTSGVQLRFIEHMNTGAAYVLCAIPFDVDALSATADLVEDVGLQPSMLDVLDKGVVLRVMMDDENARGGRMVQDEPRYAQETPWGAGAQDMQMRYALYRRRRNEEAMKLMAKYPPQAD
jgi:hypothetical protein